MVLIVNWIIDRDVDLGKMDRSITMRIIGFSETLCRFLFRAQNIIVGFVHLRVVVISNKDENF